MKVYRVICAVAASCLLSFSLSAQPEAINIHHLNTSDGLADGVVRCLGQDKYGYIWAGTLSGINRYNGYNVKVFQNSPGDTTFPYVTANAILGDKKGNLWFGTNVGLYRFDFASSHFIHVAVNNAVGIFKIVETAPGRLYLATSSGLFQFESGGASMSKIEGMPDVAISDITVVGNKLYMATSTGIIAYHTITKKLSFGKLPADMGDRVNRIAVDVNGNVWGSYGDQYTQLFRTDTLFHEFRKINEFTTLNKLQGSSITSLFVDQQQRLWITTPTLGIVQYDPVRNALLQYHHDPRQPHSVATNHFNKLFQDNKGFIWAASEGYGIDYFHPDNNLFRVIAPGKEENIDFPSLWGRAYAEDSEGNTWLGWGGGLLKRLPNGKYIHYRNLAGQDRELYSNSIRSLLVDSNRIWIGTSDGINRYDIKSGRMEFMDEADSLPKSFYWSILKDRRGTTWFGTATGLYYYDAALKKYRPVSSHPVLGKLRFPGVRSIYEDSRGWLWFGLNGFGLIMYDPDKKITRSWQRDHYNNTSLVGNTITSITEDHKGVIWTTSFLGITGYDPVKDKFYQFTSAQGLPSIKTSCIAVDGRDRLWVGSAAGLLMLDSSRKRIKIFDINDGLPVMEFNDQQAYILKNGQFLFPTLKGFVLFDPLSYNEALSVPPLMLASVKVYNKELKTGINFEALNAISLFHNQNFFSLELTALNYHNPKQTWYAYQLEGFDKTWIYTQERVVNYTNVPGGDYTFRYKATTDPNNWDVPEKTLQISIGTVFYKTSWFWMLVALLIAAGLYGWYRNRLHQQHQVHQLQSKAQTLEKEKALVMYESLKQQLNPHFLFNSLTSLGSLINSDPKVAVAFLDSLSKTYRYILKSRDSELVALIDEIRFAESYVRLQQTRFEKGLEVNISVDEAYRHRRIVPVTLQNMIENAIKHNIIDEESPLVIKIEAVDDHLVISNNLQKKNFVETSNRQGLSNLQSLYHYLSTEPVQIIETPTCFTVKIPLL